MKITPEIVELFFNQVEEENHTVENGSPLASAYSLRIKLLGFAGAKDMNEYQERRAKAKQFIEDLAKLGDKE